MCAIKTSLNSSQILRWAILSLLVLALAYQQCSQASFGTNLFVAAFILLAMHTLISLYTFEQEGLRTCDALDCLCQWERQHKLYHKR